MQNLCKFRCRSHDGRFIEVTQADLKCTLCKGGVVGDEYHYLCVCSYFNAERTTFLGNGMILNPVTYKHLLNSINASTLKQIFKFIGLIFSKFVYMENIDRDVILLLDNVVPRSGRAVIRPTRLDEYSFYILYFMLCFFLVVSSMIVQYNVYVLSYPVVGSIEK